MKRIAKCNLLISMLMISLFCNASDEVLPDSIAIRFNKQLQLYPQEKLYVQTDKPYYIGGEDLWFRAFLTDYTSNIPDTTSRYVYTELVDPMDSVLVRVKTIPRDGAYYGSILLREDLPEGMYRLRSYTRYMEGLGEDYFFRRNIYIGDSLSADYRTLADFTFDNEEKELRIRLRVEEIKTGSLFEAKELRVQNRKGEMQVLKMSEDSIYRYNCRVEKDLQNRLLYIEYDYLGRYHKQYIPVPYPETEYDVSFLPEGGCFPSETSVKIAFKALSGDGLGEEITGEVLDSVGIVRAKFESNVLGMGTFSLKAMAGERLYANCKNRAGVVKRFELPVAEPSVCTLGGQWTGNILNLYVTVASDAVVPDSLYLLIHTRGALLYCAVWDGNRKYLQIKNSELPSGVLQAVLVDSNMVPLSERLFFNLNEADLCNLEYHTNSSVYHKRELIDTEVKVEENDSIQVSGNFSVSVTSDKDITRIHRIRF
ncbi:hypothetical protein [Parabacteroides sp. AM08-6]|uniref:hypothetical protein n=1 Tax=Parabacteroides sp. AM08-6 TaxID=2292053 RepID=UPI0011C488D0|nr:hypothetical protein [Parabacteroides sp. AM08-6]